MSLLEMSLHGGILILAVAVLRAVVLNRVPKRTFLALWAVAAARLLLPFRLPSPLSVYNLELPERVPAAPLGTLPAPLPAPVQTPAAAPVDPVPAAAGAAFPIWQAVWLAGTLLCAGAFLFAYLRCRREFRTALPAEDECLTLWLSRRRLLRPVAIRQSDRITAPLTYGVLRPVILLPSGADWSGGRLEWVLEHEFVHIRRFDVMTKLVLAAAACVHWFNPLVWCMYALANRDIELGCDEAVVRRLGVDRRGEYAMTLITMEERKSGLGPFASAFSKNAIEERITAIMKLKKRSLAAILAAVALICVVTTGFATSADGGEDLRDYLTVIPGNDFTREESQKLFALWFDGYEEMTVAEYREKLRGERGDADMELIERFSLSGAVYQLPAGKEADALAAFNDYFFNVYEPLTADQWQTREFDGVGANGAEYMYTLTVQNAAALKVGEYEQICKDVDAALRQPVAEMSDALKVEERSIPALKVELGYYTAPSGDDPDALLHTQSSRESAAQWDRQLSPYVPFGLTYSFDDPDLDGNGLTMWFEGKEVRGIFDEQEGIWITEHSGITTYSTSDAVELYTVYTDGVLTGLRLATPEEQAAFTSDREQNSAQLNDLNDISSTNTQEQREFPRATQEDYEALMSLQTPGYENLSLEEFNQQLLDWANANSGAWDRINCDVAWNDCPTDHRQFAAGTCHYSGNENGAMVRALYTGAPEQDPSFAASLPERSVETNGICSAWCDLYYNISYHVADKSAATVAERDACVQGMQNAITCFWRDTDLDTLLGMTKEDMVAQFNVWAAENSTANVCINPVTASHIHYECADERHLYNEFHHEEPVYPSGNGHHSSGHHSDRHHG